MLKKAGLLMMAVGVMLATQAQQRQHDTLAKVAVKPVSAAHSAMMHQQYELLQFRGSGEHTVARYKKFAKEFPEPAKDTLLVHDYLRKLIASNYLLENKVKETVYWLNQIRDSSFNADAKLYKAEEIAQIGDSATALTLYLQAAQTYKWLLDQGDTNNQRLYHVKALTPAAVLLYKAGRYAEALQYAMIAATQETPMKNEPPVKVIYALALAANGKDSAAFTLMERLLKNGEATAVVKKVFPQVYEKVKGTTEGYATYMAEVKMLLRLKLAEKLGKEMISEHAPAFTLKDINGNTVSLTDYKDKVVVLDFWATWCGPCKMSFPVMQQTIHRYSKDPDVHFLFVDCWEGGLEPEPEPVIRHLLTRNRYTFQVLMDASKRGAGITQDYKVAALPTKFVIDGKGKIRFKVRGFREGDDAAMEELSMMIDLAKE